MLKHRFLIPAFIASIVVGQAAAQSTISVDLLDAGDEGFAGIPAFRRCVDIFVDIDVADVWTASGIRLTAHQGASLFYDYDPNFPPKFQPPLFNPGVERKFATSLSRPRPRDANERFTNAGAAAAGAFDPPGALVVFESTELRAAYFASPPMSSGSPSVDGYIARIAVDVGAVVSDDEYSGWFAGDLADAPAGALIVLRSEPASAVAGTVFTTFDDPTLRGINWGLGYVPEPSEVCAFIVVSAMMLSRKRRNCHG